RVDAAVEAAEGEIEDRELLRDRRVGDDAGGAVGDDMDEDGDVDADEAALLGGGVVARDLAVGRTEAEYRLAHALAPCCARSGSEPGEAAEGRDAEWVGGRRCGRCARRRGGRREQGQ